MVSQVRRATGQSVAQTRIATLGQSAQSPIDCANTPIPTTNAIPSGLDHGHRLDLAVAWRIDAKRQIREATPIWLPSPRLAFIGNKVEPKPIGLPRDRC